MQKAATSMPRIELIMFILSAHYWTLECEVLCNKLSDQAAHIKLKDKHINVLSLELSNSQV